MNKILYIIDYPLSVIGGAQGSTLVLSKLLKKEAIETCILAPDNGTNLDIEVQIMEYKVHKNFYINVFSSLLQFTKVLKSNEYTIIHPQMPIAGIVIGIMKKLGLIKKNKIIIFTDRGLINLYRKHTQFLLKNLGDVSDNIICTTEANKKMWDKILKDNKKTVVIGNTVEKSFKDYDDRKRTEIRKQNNISKEDIVIGFAGRITRVKNWPLAIEICEKIKKEELNIKIALALTAYSNDEKRQLDEMVARIKTIIGYENVIVGKELSQFEMSDFYYNIDIFILTSELESFGKTALEAMTRKCCVLTTNCIGTPEVVGNEKFVVKDNKADKFIKKIVHYYNNRAELREDKEGLYQRYLNNYTEDIILQKHLNLYNKFNKEN